VARYAQEERHTLADLLFDLGPDAPTLCEGWTTRDLAAHLVTRERRPDAAAGLMIPSLRERGERVRRRLAATPYPELIELVRIAPWWSPVSNPLVDGLTNTVEFFIHHEDVRRAQPDWQPRTLPPDEAATLWARGKTSAKLSLRRFRGTVVLHAPGYGESQAGAGGPQVRVTGAPGELLMFSSGRQRAAHVTLDGPSDLVAQLSTAKLGL
jgi:uncharacterized protein (TIGR03085 family)